MRDDLPPGLPPDPFAGDPDDPTAHVAGPEPGRPLDAEESRAVEQDLVDLARYEAQLSPLGRRGLVVGCEGCRSEHYSDWDMLRSGLLQLLVEGVVRPHEPAFDPDPGAYVTWEYCRGWDDASTRASGP